MFGLEHISDRITTNRTIVVCPMIDTINDKTLEFSSIGVVAVGGFTWSLFFTWRDVPQSEMKRRKSDADPIRCVQSSMTAGAARSERVKAL